MVAVGYLFQRLAQPAQGQRARVHCAGGGDRDHQRRQSKNLPERRLSRLCSWCGRRRRWERHHRRGRGGYLDSRWSDRRQHRRGVCWGESRCHGWPNPIRDGDSPHGVCTQVMIIADAYPHRILAARRQRTICKPPVPSHLFRDFARAIFMDNGWPAALRIGYC